jgi:hypothetical protein
MLRAIRIVSVCFLITLGLAGISQAQAQSTYELGPYVAFGIGESESEAEGKAYIEVWEIVDSVEEYLPEGHEVVGLLIGGEDWIGDTYSIEFYIVVQYDPTPPEDGKDIPGQ